MKLLYTLISNVDETSTDTKKFVGRRSIRDVNIGLKSIGEQPDYTVIDIEFEVSSDDAKSIRDAMNNIDIEWFRRLIHNTILIDKSEEHLFTDMELLINVFTLNVVGFEEMMQIVTRLLIPRVEVYNCKLRSVSFSPK